MAFRRLNCNGLKLVPTYRAVMMWVLDLAQQMCCPELRESKLLLLAGS